MFSDGIGFGIVKDGVPFVTICRGKYEFETAEAAAGFAAARILARLRDYQQSWHSIAEDLEAFSGVAADDADIPF